MDINKIDKGVIVETKLKPVTEVEEQILELYSKGISRKDIAFQLDLPLITISRVLTKPQNKEIVNEMIEHRALMLKSKHLDILEEVTDRMIDEADGDILEAVNKNRDILDVVNLTNTVTQNIEKKRLGDTGGNTIINILNQLSGD